MKSLIAIATALVIILAGGMAARAAEPEFAFHQIGRDAYVFRMNNRNSPVIVGSNGVLVMDSQNTFFAPIIKREIEKRFHKPVKWLVYSHANADHVRGAAVFADTATVIAQKRQLPRLRYIKEDSFPLPDVLFDKEMTIDLGGKTVILHDFGINHATGVIVMELPDDKVITTIDMVYKHRLGFYFMPDFNPRAWLASLKTIMKTLDFDRVVVGHGSVTASRAEMADFIGYLEDLHKQVRAVWKRTHHLGPHKGLDIARRDVDLTKYQDWGFYDRFRDLNIMAVYLALDMGY